MSGGVGLFFIDKTVRESVSQFPLKCTVNVYQELSGKKKHMLCAYSFAAESKYLAESCFAVGDTLSQMSSHHRRIEGILLLQLWCHLIWHLLFGVGAQEMCFVDCTNQKFTQSHQLKKNSRVHFIGDLPD